MPKPDLDAIKARLEAATPGPWGCTPGNIVKMEYDARSANNAVCGKDLFCVNYASGEDMDLVAHAPTDIAALLEYVRELEEVAAPKYVYTDKAPGILRILRYEAMENGQLGDPMPIYVEVGERHRGGVQ